jgi:hypothetical protein
VDEECRLEMDEHDGFRLLWGLLKHPSSMVQASAAWAIRPYVESDKVIEKFLRVDFLILIIHERNRVTQFETL